MKLDHLLWSARGLALLDTDGCALADPALDLGKLIADLRWWALDGGLDDPSAWEPALLRGYRPGAALMERAQAYASMLLVKMAGRRVPVSSRDWTHRIEALLALAASRRPAVLEATA
jgi:aminoglycoside phosphotransferase (APT) family kinase protein